MSCTRYHPPEEESDIDVRKIMSYVRGHAALGGGKLALFGTGSFHMWATTLDELTGRFRDETRIDRTKMFDDSCGRYDNILARPSGKKVPISIVEECISIKYDIVFVLLMRKLHFI